MADSDLELCLSGPDAERLATELADFLDAEFGTRPAQSTEKARPKDVVTRSGDPVAVTALILSIPSVLLATADLAKRLEVKKKVDRLLDWVRRKAPADSPNRIEMRDADGRSLPLERADTSEVLEISAQVSLRVTRSREP